MDGYWTELYYGIESVKWKKKLIRILMKLMNNSIFDHTFYLMHIHRLFYVKNVSSFICV